MIKPVTSVSILLLVIISQTLWAQLVVGKEYPPSTASLDLPENVVSAGEQYWLELVLNIPPGWHTYWTNPGDGGAAPIIQWSLPEGFQIGDTHWPLPGRFSEGEITSYGYDKEVRLRIPVNLAPDIPSGSWLIEAEVEWLYCLQVCIPAFASVSVAIEVGDKFAPEYQTTGAYPSSYPEILSSVTLNRETLELRVSAERVLPNPDDGKTEPWFYPFEWGTVNHSGNQIWTIEGEELVALLPVGQSVGRRIRGLLVIHQNGEPVAGYTVDTPVVQ